MSPTHKPGATNTMYALVRLQPEQRNEFAKLMLRHGFPGVKYCPYSKKLARFESNLKSERSDASECSPDRGLLLFSKPGDDGDVLDSVETTTTTPRARSASGRFLRSRRPSPEPSPKRRRRIRSRRRLVPPESPNSHSEPTSTAVTTPSSCRSLSDNPEVPTPTTDPVVNKKAKVKEKVDKVKSASTRKDMRNCAKCGHDIVNKRSSLITHCKRHVREKQFNCRSCIYAHHERHMVDKHWNREHEKEQEVQIREVSREDLEPKWREMMKTCFADTKTKDAQNEVTSVSTTTDGNTSEFVCCECSHYIAPPAVDQHILTMHREQCIKFKCASCGLTEDGEVPILYHAIVEHPTQDLNVVPCDKAGDQYALKKKFFPKIDWSADQLPCNNVTADAFAEIDCSFMAALNANVPIRDDLLSVDTTTSADFWWPPVVDNSVVGSSCTSSGQTSGDNSELLVFDDGDMLDNLDSTLTMEPGFQAVEITEAFEPATGEEFRSSGGLLSFPSDFNSPSQGRGGPIC